MSSTRPTFSHLVVIGASAGGVEALSTLVAGLPTPFPAPIVIAQHLDPNSPSHLDEVLSHHSTAPVETARDGQVLEPGHLYVVPPNTQVRIVNARLQVRPAGTERFKPSIDHLFSSAAEVYEERTIAVVLSGTSSDGAAGARQVKVAGGTVLIQDPATALYPDMPLSLARPSVDLVAQVEQMGALLAELVAGTEHLDKPEERRSVESFLEDLRARMGLDFTNYKTPTILRRLQRRMLATDTRTLEEYSAYLTTHPQEYHQLISSFLIKVTEFFRDPELFAYLRSTIIPDLLAQAQQHGRELRIWSSGCATGEEAYSLAMVFAEALEALSEAPKLRIFATDLDTDAIALARRGIYPLAALAGLSEEVIDRYFTRHNEHCQIKKQVRQLLVFGQHDLSQRAAFPQMDLVVCRNVLIYFTPELQQRSLQLFTYSLREGGYLVLGKAESTGALAEYFTPTSKALKVYRRRHERILMPPARVPIPRLRAAPRAPLLAPAFREEATPPPEKEPPRLRAFGESVLLQLPVGLALVNRHYDIQAINQAARRLLSIYGPAVGEDLVHLAESLPAREVQRHLDLAFQTGEPALLEEVRIERVTSEEPTYLQLLFAPQAPEKPRGPVQAVLVVITEVTGLAQARHQADTQRQQAEAQMERLRREAEREVARHKAALDEELQRAREEVAATKQRQEVVNQRLVETNRQLVGANEELTQANEALRAEIEELVVRNEEAQASTEEVETLNEEMQATSEELETLNEELQSTVEELHSTNDDLQTRNLELQDLARTSQAERAQMAAILQSIDSAILVINPAGKVVLTNPVIEQFFGSAGAAFVAEDAQGHSLPPEARPQQRAARGEAFRLGFSAIGPDGQRYWYEAHSQPIRGPGGMALGGALIIQPLSEPQPAPPAEEVP